MAKPAQLVCQHLENISREALEKYQKIIRNYVRGRQGVYALCRRGWQRLCQPRVRKTRIHFEVRLTFE
jgi:hypothetical protein